MVTNNLTQTYTPSSCVLVVLALMEATFSGAHMEMDSLVIRLSVMGSNYLLILNITMQLLIDAPYLAHTTIFIGVSTHWKVDKQP